MFGLREEDVTLAMINEWSRERGDCNAWYFVTTKKGAMCQHFLKGSELMICLERHGAEELEWARIFDLREISTITAPACEVKNHVILPSEKVQVVGEQFYKKFEPKRHFMIPMEKAFYIPFPRDMELLSYEEYTKFRNAVLATIIAESIKQEEWENNVNLGLPTAERIAEYVMKRLGESGDFEIGIGELVEMFSAGEHWDESLSRFARSERLPFYFYGYKISNGERIAVCSNEAESVAFRIRKPRP